jgi:hypothetical protein
MPDVPRMLEPTDSFGCSPEAKLRWRTSLLLLRPSLPSMLMSPFAWAKRIEGAGILRPGHRRDLGGWGIE